MLTSSAYTGSRLGVIEHYTRTGPGRPKRPRGWGPGYQQAWSDSRIWSGLGFAISIRDSLSYIPLAFYYHLNSLYFSRTKLNPQSCRKHSMLSPLVYVYAPRFHDPISGVWFTARKVGCMRRIQGPNMGKNMIDVPKTNMWINNNKNILNIFTMFIPVFSNCFWQEHGQYSPPKTWLMFVAIDT